MNIEEKYEIWVHYRTPEHGNWTAIAPGWQCFERDLSFEDMLSRKKNREEGYERQTVYDLPIKIVRVTREVIDVE